MPALPGSLIEPLWAEFAALLPRHPVVAPTHPRGCHRRRVPDRVVFDHVVAALVDGSGSERIASPGCSDRTIRRRVGEWADAGLAHARHPRVLAQYDRMIGLALDDGAVDGCMTKAPGANHHAAPLLGPTLAGLDRVGVSPPELTGHLDRGDDSGVTRALLDTLGFTGEIARTGLPAPLQAGKRWVVERTQSWMNGFGKLRRCTEKTHHAVDFSLFLAAACGVTRCLIQTCPVPVSLARPAGHSPAQMMPIAGRSKRQ